MIKGFARALLPRRIRPHKILRGPLRGHMVVTSWHDYPGAILGYTEKHLIQWLTNNVGVGETWLDIGAHYGYTAVALATQVGPTGRVFAFEPIVGTAGHLSLTRSLNGLDWLTVVPVGLSSSSGLRTISVSTTRGMAEHAGLANRTDQICTARFDEIWPTLSGGYETIQGVKVDVQGAEIDVILGMRTQLTKWKPKLVVELHPGVDRTAFVDLVEAIGYRSAGQPVTGDAAGPPYLDDRSYVFLGRSLLTIPPSA